MLHFVNLFSCKNYIYYELNNHTLGIKTFGYPSLHIL